MYFVLSYHRDRVRPGRLPNPAKHHVHELGKRPIIKPTTKTPVHDASPAFHIRILNHCLQPLNGRISGISHAHPDLRTSWARTACCRRRGGYGRIGREPASAGSWSARQRTFGSRRRWIWRWLGGWRRSGKCDHHRRRGRGCRHRLLQYHERVSSGCVVMRFWRTEFVNTEDQDGLVDLEAQDLGLDEGKRLSVDLDETLTGLKIVWS